jgi:hypothetical protein
MSRSPSIVLALAALVAPCGVAAMDRCSLLTAEEAAAAMGGPVGPGYPAGPMQTACQWDGTADDGSYVQVQLIDDPDDWSPPTLADGYVELTGIGEKAYVVPEMGGFAAGALDGRHIIVVGLAGDGASAESAGSLLRLAVERVRGG